MRSLIRLILVCTSLVVAGPCLADMRALLIGVSDYDGASGIADLKGPPNDVALMRDVLVRRGFRAPVLLADGIEGATRPTRSAILAALADLAQSTGAGDMVYIHFSGHGTQQRDISGDESDGLDEVFLPADAAPAEAGSGLIVNALTDDDLGAAITKIRKTGAQVWVVMDSCHSGSGLRAGTDRSAARFVAPDVLGAGAGSVLTQAKASEALETDSGDGLLAFYAAQSYELAREINLAREGASEAWYGVFSAALATRLDSGVDTTFRQLYQAVLRDMHVNGATGLGAIQTPLWDGALIDAPLFGANSTARHKQRHAVRGTRLEAGLVHGASSGTLIALFADVSDEESQMLGLAQVQSADATQAVLRAVATSCQADRQRLCDASGSLPEAARFAEIRQRPVAQDLYIAPPRALIGGQRLGTEHAAYVALREAVASLPDGMVKISDQSSPIDVIWDGSALWFGQHASVAGTPMGLSWTPGHDPLAPLLERIAKAEGLARNLFAAAGTPSMLNPNPVAVTARVSEVNRRDLVQSDSDTPPAEECANASRGARDATELFANAQLKQCDALTFTAQGRVGGARDVNRIHIDAQFCVHTAYARVEDTQAAAQLGPDMTLCSDCPGGYSAGTERLFVLVSEVQPGVEALNLTGLIETCDAAGQTLRGASVLPGVPLRRLRSGGGGFSRPTVWLEPFSWTVLPKVAVLARPDSGLAAQELRPAPIRTLE